MRKKLTIAIVQEGPVFNHLEHSLQKAELLTAEAADRGAELVVFGECWLCGYPAWLDHCPDIGLWDYEPTKEVYARMWHNAVEVPGPACERLAALARKEGVTLAIGINERVSGGPGNGTLYNSFLLFDAQGRLLLHHRKLMPTFTEKLLYGLGDGRGLCPAPTEWGAIGGLICWEHWMPLARQALHDHGETIHLAFWPQVHEMLQIASRHYAFEGRCFVVAAGQFMRRTDVPPELERPQHWSARPDAPLLHGGSCIVAPNGHYLLPPQWGSEGILVHTLDDLDHPIRERMALDVSGHYQRPDVFRLEVQHPKERF